MVSRPAPPSRAEFRAWQTISTRWADNDLYGHVNNTVYYQWFDSAVNAWLIGQGLLDLHGGELIALVAQTRCTYHAPLSFPGDVEVGLGMLHLGRSSISYRIGVFSVENESASADGEFVHVAVDRTTRRPVPWPERWRSAFATLVA